MTPAEEAPQRLAELATTCGVQLSYTAQDGQSVVAAPDTLRAVLAALGHPAESDADVEATLDAVTAHRRRQVLDPVAVVGVTGQLLRPIRLDPDRDPGGCWLAVDLEDGTTRRHRLGDLAMSVSRPTDADEPCEATVSLAALDLPSGYHRLSIEGLGAAADALLLVPPRLPQPTGPGFGVFAPLYALRGESDWGIGTFTELRQLAETVAAWGGDLAGTLPLFAGCLADPVDPSPYRPVSRLFWNELYVDVGALPELAQCGGIGSFLAAADAGALHQQSEVDYDGVIARKRDAMQRCAAALMATPSDRRDAFESFVKAHPLLERYADFRAAGEIVDPNWHAWDALPGELPAVELRPGTVDYHRYAQFVAAEQLAAAADAPAGLYLDIPVGVHPDGFDTWDRPHLFAAAGVGAPPDRFFAGGQSWGFPPLHPERIREDGYRYLIEACRTVFAAARAVRIDHVLGLRRLFWIPPGGGPADGAYVSYRNEELRAVIAIEAERAGTIVVGEDLGTLPAGLRRAMDEDGMLHSFVYQFEASAADPLPQPREPAMSSLGSHDLPKFLAYWQDADPAQRNAVGADPRAAMISCLESLASGPSSYLLVDLADLDGDPVQDNRPGTGAEAGNWRHRLTRPLATIAADPDVNDVVSQVRAAREATAARGAIA